MIEALLVSIGIEDGELFACLVLQGHSVDEGIDDIFTFKILWFVDEINVSFSYFVDFRSIVFNDVEKTIDFLFVVSFEIVAACEDDNIS